jgi:hypothetical protein
LREGLVGLREALPSKGLLSGMTICIPDSGAIPVVGFPYEIGGL